MPVLGPLDGWSLATWARAHAKKAGEPLQCSTHAGGAAMTPEAKLAAMGLILPEIPKPMANYVPFKINGNTLYLSGQGPRRNDGSMATGKVGRDVTVEQAY
jgi:hypothetical protein